MVFNLFRFTKLAQKIDISKEGLFQELHDWLKGKSDEAFSHYLQKVPKAMRTDLIPIYAKRILNAASCAYKRHLYGQCVCSHGSCRTKKAILFRLREDLLERLKQMAKEEHRSLNNFVECILLVTDYKLHDFGGYVFHKENKIFFLFLYGLFLPC